MLKKLGLVTVSAGLLLAACSQDAEQPAEDAQTEEVVDEAATDETAADETTKDAATDEAQADADSDIGDFHFVVASHSTPMTDITELALEQLPEPADGELLQVSDNIQYNDAVFNDEAFASFAQHEPFMQGYNEKNDADLVMAQPIYNAIVGFYAPEYNSIDDIEDGASVVVPGDAFNMSRALEILAAQELITLAEVEGNLYSTEDVEENPHNFEFVEMEVSNTAQGYLDGHDLVFSYPTFIAQLADLHTDDALFLEDDAEAKYAQGLVMRKENLDTPEGKALIEAFTSDAVAEFIDENLVKSGHATRAF